MRALRRLLGVVVLVEAAILAARLLDIAGFNSKISAWAMTLLTLNVLASWIIIAHANRGRQQRSYGHHRGWSQSRW